jgi:uncharacterized SAM-binding protein YcdF (DUF218 family)
MKQRMLMIPDLLLRTLGALEIIALNCFLIIWTGGQLMIIVNNPMIAILPILGFGSMTFLLVNYFLVRAPSQEPRSQTAASHPGPQYSEA